LDYFQEQINNKMNYFSSNKKYTFIFVLNLIFAFNSGATEFDFQGQASAWTNTTYESNTWITGVGLLYIPQSNIFYDINGESFFDSELSFKSYLSTNFDGKSDQNIDFYRFNFRYATDQSETQIGLQKISFGPALLLRSLMWFDQVDVRDPLRLTNGVYALRYKYNFLNNTNIWLWGLYGNEKKKGYEIYSTADKSPEFGGRIQYPIPFGEFAQSFHYRKAGIGSFKYDEYKFAIDGRWDAMIGFWLESSFTYNATEKLPIQWNKMFTIGADYTFDIGNGLYFLTEQFASASSKAFLPFDNDYYASSYMLTYPVGILDNFRIIGFYTYQENNYYQFLDWQRTYDDIVLNLSLFYYPENQSGNLNAQSRGYGAQIMVIFNH